MLSVKATHNLETRRLVFDNVDSLSYTQLCNELRRVFPIRGPFYLCNVSITTKGDSKWTPDIHNEARFEEHIRTALSGQRSDATMLRFTIVELTVSPPIRNRVHTVPAVSRAKSSAWRTVSAITPRDTPTQSSSTAFRQGVTPQALARPNANGIEASLTQLEKDFREGEAKFSQAFNCLKGEVIRLLEQANSATRTASSTSVSANSDTCVRGQCGGASKTDDADALAFLRIPGAFESAAANSSSTTLGPSSSASAIDGQIHYNIWCDYCGRAVRGLRAKCNNCEEYDLCEQCILHHDALKKHADKHAHTFSYLPAKASTSASASTRAPPPAATVPSPCSRAAPRNSVIHYGIVCDCCGETIVGLRNKCLVCFDYDLCEKCLPQAKSLHAPSHSFYVIEQSEFSSILSGVSAHNTCTRPAQGRRPLPQPHGSNTRVVHQATCDLCDLIIMGTRHKCLDCPDYDVCSTCYSIVGEQHPNHVFIAITTPQSLASKNPARTRMHHANCDACKKPIFNVRYKCMHPECPDYDLCDNCEALPIAVHPSTHPMLKMRHPLTVIPTVYRVGGQTIIPDDRAPDDRASASSCCGVPTTTTPVTQSSAELGKGIPGSFDLNDIADITVVATSAEVCNVEKTPQMKPSEELPTLRDVPKDEMAFALSPELDAPVSLPASVTGRLSLKQMLSEPLATAAESLSQVLDEKAASAAHALLRSLPSDGPAFGLKLKQELRATFVSNNNVADGQIFPAGAEFVKSWRMVNDGDVPWPDSTEVLFVAGDRLAADEHAPSRFTVGRVEPGQEIDVTAGELKAPDTPGKYVGYWKLSDGSGRTFGQSMWCEIVVADAETTQSKSLSSSEVIMPSSAPSVVSTTASAPNIEGHVEPTTPTTPSVSSGIPSSDIDTDESSALLEEFETASDVADWEDLREQMNRGVIDPEYVVLYDEDHTDDE